MSFDKRYAWLVFFIFLGQGISDTIFNDFAQNFDYEKKYLFFMVLFFIASISGFIINNVKKLLLFTYSPDVAKSSLENSRHLAVREALQFTRWAVSVTAPSKKQNVFVSSSI